MLFNSYEFILLFLPLVFFGYFYLLQKRLATAAKSFLVFSSLFFYSWWNIAYLPIILSSILFNYSIGNSLNGNIESIKVAKNRLLTLGVIANLSLLAYFKYTNFFIENINALIEQPLGLVNIALPLAISFFTFQQIAYLVDSYRAETREYEFINYALFVTFFPQLIAGPIVHHSEMMPQFSSKWNLIKKHKNIALGLFIFSIGLFKKTVIADTFSQWANYGFSNTETLNLIDAWVTSLSYSFQLYFDFSGYTDMATGAALLFNIKLPINFNSPYKATNIQDFWRRWHITLSRFMKDYIYIPLGGNRNSEYKTYTNLSITFLIGGLWHGAGWTFVFWGGLHAIALSAHKLWQKTGLKIGRFSSWLITFNFVNVAWVFFRADEWNDAINILKSMIALNNIILPLELGKPLFFIADYDIEFNKDWISIPDSGFQCISLLVLALIIILTFKNSNQILSQLELNKKTAIFAGITFTLGFLSLTRASEFLYFNF